jgi:GNAT superfamily N-acetyltransferase
VFTFGPLADDERPIARRLTAAAFAGEAFATGMFGPSPLERLVGMVGDYADWPWSDHAEVTVARQRGVLLAMAAVTPPEHCALCDHWVDDIDPTESVAAQMERDFRLSCRAAHVDAQLPPHAHVKSVATDPFLVGQGVGARLMEFVVDSLWTAGVEAVVLECLTAREAFYGRFGFRRIAAFPDPGGPDLTAVLMRIDHP